MKVLRKKEDEKKSLFCMSFFPAKYITHCFAQIPWKSNSRAILQSDSFKYPQHKEPNTTVVNQEEAVHYKFQFCVYMTIFSDTRSISIYATQIPHASLYNSTQPSIYLGFFYSIINKEGKINPSVWQHV